MKMVSISHWGMFEAPAKSQDQASCLPKTDSQMSELRGFAVNAYYRETEYHRLNFGKLD
jgi:hypothetical protein